MENLSHDELGKQIRIAQAKVALVNITDKGTVEQQELKPLINEAARRGYYIGREFEHLLNTPKSDNLINHPPHYNKGKFETIDVIEDITSHHNPLIRYHVGCAIKYFSRAPHKGDYIGDMKKAQWYLNRAIALLETSK